MYFERRNAINALHGCSFITVISTRRNIMVSDDLDWMRILIDFGSASSGEYSSRVMLSRWDKGEEIRFLDDKYI